MKTHKYPECDAAECPRCGVMPGELHVPDCTVERCPYCGGQAIGCEPAPMDDRMPWTGLWPGVAECREFGWYARPMPGGWLPCEKDKPGAIEDLNRLYAEARWDRESKRFILTAMTLTEFWRLIETAKDESEGDSERQVELLAEKLSELTVEEIVAFDEILEDLLDHLLRDDLWDVASMIHDGFCSDDGFEYFRCWIIAQGEAMYDRSRNDPEDLIGLVEPVAWCESILYIAKDAYQMKTGHDTDEVWENWPPT
jgi:hypothetical protein